MEILDVTLIAEFTAIVNAGVQAMKNRPQLKNVDGEVLAFSVGLIVGLGWFLVTGRIADADSYLHVNWVELVRGVLNGGAAGLAASGVFNLQTYLPMPNLLPTRTEKSAPAQAQEEVV